MVKTSGSIVGHMPLMGPQTNHSSWKYLQLLSQMYLSVFTQVFISLQYFLVIFGFFSTWSLISNSVYNCH